MKTRLLFLILLTATATLAQQPDAGFGRKRKTAPPIPGLAERLGAEVIPIPANRTGRQTLVATGGAHPSMDGLRLRVVRDAATDLPIFIERQLTKRATSASSRARLSAVAAVSITFQFMVQIRNLLRMSDPSASFVVATTETDDLSQTHVRLTQTHKGVPVYGSELVAHLTGGDVTLLNGRYRPIPDNLPTQPRLALGEAASRALADVRKTSIVRSFGDNILNMKPSEGVLCVFPTSDGAKLAYELTVRPSLLERWEYVIDALTGEVLDKYNNTCTFDGPIKATARDLNGVSRSIQTYQQGNNYYLLDATRPMFNAAKSKMPDDPTGAIWTVDAQSTFGDNQKVYQITSSNNTNWNPTAVSAHHNAGIAYDYYRTTFNRNAITGTGATMISLINVVDDDGTGLDNAYWNGKIIAYGNGNKAFKPLAGALDVAGHEMTHGVIQNTANLQYKSQSGAINESMADVFGAMIERSNWTMGEGVIKTAGYFPSGALRDLSNPNQGGKDRDPNGYQPATMSQYENTNDDNGGVHINSGIPNFAFYKFASVVGKDKAEKVYYRALTTYLVRTSQFLDLRLAIIKATSDLFGTPGAEVTAARNAFDAVGIVEGSTPTPTKQPDVPVAAGQDLLLLADAGTSQLYSTNVAQKPVKFDQKTTSKLLHRPSVTDDGKVAYYVSSDKRIRAINLTGTPTETIISNETIWDNVAISKDGTKLAALTAAKDGSIYVYSYAQKVWKQFKLYNPTYSTGVKTGDVQYADSFEWDFTGEYVVYDAYNALKNATGNAIDYWDVGFIKVWDNRTATFGDGSIDKLFSDLDEGESVGNPSFSKNSPDILAFDYVNETDDVYYVVATDISKGDLKGVYRNTTLGFPSYSRLDNQLVFSTASGTSEDVSSISLAADKLSASGSATVLYTGAKWPVWYTQSSRVLPTRTTQIITFDAIADRYANEGDLTLRATSSANLPVSFQVRSGPATLSGTTLRITGIGTVTVRAYQDGNAQVYAATAVDRTFKILAVTGTEPGWAEAISLYPNPVGSTLTVELPGLETIESLTLRTLVGVPVLQPTIRPRQRSVTLDVSQLPKGLYLLQIQAPNGTANRKIIKE